MANAEMSIKLNQADMDKVYAALGDIKKAPDAVMRRAVNRVLTGIRTDAVGEIAKVITPAKKVIRKTFTVKKMAANSLDAWVKSAGPPMNLIKYKAKQTKAGVTVQINKGDTRVLFPGAFIAMGKGRNKVVLDRKKTSPYKSTGASPNLAWPRFAPGKHPMRYPVKGLSGPAVPDVMKRPEIMKVIETKAAARLTKRIDHEIDYELSKHR
jgi:hypothetical protein